MANLVTLATLKARALDYADMTSSAFPDTARLTDYVNTAACELYDLLVNSHETYFLTQTQIAITSGTGDYSLPAGFYKLIRAFWVDSDRRHEIRKFTLSSLHGSKLSPAQSGTVELWYVPEMDLMSADGDTVADKIPPAVRGWEDFIALGVAVRLLMREESDSSQLMAEREVIRGRIMSMAEPRDEGSSDVVQDAGRRWDDTGDLTAPSAHSMKYRLMGGFIKFIHHEVGA